ncbi:unnamed protein product, partial [marine sediment metagenome]
VKAVEAGVEATGADLQDQLLVEKLYLKSFISTLKITIYC